MKSQLQYVYGPITAAGVYHYNESIIPLYNETVRETVRFCPNSFSTYDWP